MMKLANSSRRRAFALAGGAVVSSCLAFAPARAEGAKSRCAEYAGLSLPEGFCATVFADHVGHARQMVVAPDGTLYVNSWSGVYYGNDKPHDGGFLVALKDTKGTGKADIQLRFGPSITEGAHGGTGIWRFKHWIYAEANDKIVRYDIGSGQPAADARPEIVLSGMPITGDHPMHPFAIDGEGNLFVSMGSATNDCEAKNRMPHSAGNDPCTELETRAGVWRYRADALNQIFSPRERYFSGSRNTEGFDFDSAGRLFVTQHGRDQLHEDWPELFTAEQGFELPAEQMMIAKQGAWYGWPNCYFDPRRRKLVLSPEYGGDGEKVGVCEQAEAPVAYYPAHWAPNDLKIYSGSLFPKAYSGGAFIAFHGSWNRAPGPQGGYNVVFQPLADGKPTGDYIVFADGFAGRYKEPGRAVHRPSGLAVAPDGTLFISDDQAGRIWRVTYVGDRSAPIAAARTLHSLSAASPMAEPPEGVHPDASAQSALPVPPGSSAQEVALGKKIFHGEAGGATCAGCHGADGVGTPVGAALNTGSWLWSDGSLAGLTKTIEDGVTEPKQHTGAMPPLGGVALSKANIEAIAAYVWALGHRSDRR
jgi:glucose/arabinose dehydrogenase/mono/diheme cytochrome c family protein